MGRVTIFFSVTFLCAILGLAPGARGEDAGEGTANDVALDLTDIRYARSTSLGGGNFSYGFTINNSPRRATDLWGGGAKSYKE